MKLKTLAMTSLISVLLVGCGDIYSREYICNQFDYIYFTSEDRVVSQQLKKGLVYHNETLEENCKHEIGFM